MLAVLIYFAVRSHRRWRGAHQLVLIPLMVLLPVVVLDILVDKLSEVSLTQRHDSRPLHVYYPGTEEHPAKPR